MKLNEFAALKRREVLEDLAAGKDPREGEFSHERLLDCRRLGKPQMGPVIYEPKGMVLEFIYRGVEGETIVFTVQIDSPQRIVHMGVPEWVIENVWQGDVAGSYHFESDAHELLSRFGRTLEEGENAALFTARQKQGREGAF